MSLDFNETQKFNLKLAIECSDAFSVSTGLGCTVSDVSGKVLYETGYSYSQCKFCSAITNNSKKFSCKDVQMYGMSQSERFGGKYIYFCPAGLTCFVSPIMGETDISEGVAKITAGPLLMIDYDDFVHLDLEEKMHLKGDKLKNAKNILKDIPCVSPKRVSYMSTLLFMSVGFINNICACNKMLETQQSNTVQGQISDFIMYLKKGNNSNSKYPFDKEHELMQSITECNKEKAQRLLNELFGYIFFSLGGNFEKIKSRVYELLVLASRAAIEGGADSSHMLDLSYTYLSQINSLKSVEELCFWLTDVMNRFIDSVFRFNDIKHVDVIYKSVQYIRNNYTKKITLDDIAENVFLSPSYFSKIFKQEMGCNFTEYLNKIRIEKSKKLLLSNNIKLVDIANFMGFEDQSYFSKVFKKLTGISPGKFRESKGRIKK